MDVLNSFNGDRLKKARIYRGLTVAELAEKLDCQRQTISMYESNKILRPDDKVIESIADILNFPIKFFQEQSKPIKRGSTYFRALLTTNKKYRNEQVQKMELISEIYNFLMDYIEFPILSIPDINKDTTPEEAALQLRKEWGLGSKPIENIIYEVEQHGIIVTTFPTTTDDIDAFSQMFDADGTTVYIIGYTSNKTSAARIHFDICHELGHICLHEWSEDIEILTKEEFKERENEANRFASAFLLPEETFRKDIEKDPLNLVYYKQLKAKWKVSIAAMIRRSYSLGVISIEQYQTLIRILQRRGMRKEEPLDDILITASPSLLKTSIHMLLSENIFTPKELLDELSFEYNLSLHPEEIEFLLDLPKGILNSKVVKFPELQIKK